MKEITLFGGKETGRKLRINKGLDCVNIPEMMSVGYVRDASEIDRTLNYSTYVKANLVFREIVGKTVSGHVYKELVIDNVFVPEDERLVYERTLADILVKAMNTDWEIKRFDYGIS